MGTHLVRVGGQVGIRGKDPRTAASPRTDRPPSTDSSSVDDPDSRPMMSRGCPSRTRSGASATPSRTSGVGPTTSIAYEPIGVISCTVAGSVPGGRSCRKADTEWGNQ